MLNSTNSQFQEIEQMIYALSSIYNLNQTKYDELMDRLERLKEQATDCNDVSLAIKSELNAIANEIDSALRQIEEYEEHEAIRRHTNMMDSWYDTRFL